jgi:hypothetical protein
VCAFTCLMLACDAVASVVSHWWRSAGFLDSQRIGIRFSHATCRMVPTKRTQLRWSERIVTLALCLVRKSAAITATISPCVDDTSWLSTLIVRSNGPVIAAVEEWAASWVDEAAIGRPCRAWEVPWG